MRQLTNQSPLISVILPVHNAQKYLIEALESIRYQTYPHFEVIAIDDASTDNSLKILKNYSKIDPRFKVYHNKTNLKIANTLNFGVRKAKGLFLARMDADDVSMPSRFQKQISFLTKHPGVIVVGGQCLTIDTNSKITGKKLFPTNHIAINELMFTANPLQHPSIVIRRDLLPSNFAWYNPKLTPAEDLDLYFRLGKFGLFANLKSTVLMYRQHEDSETFRNPKLTFKVTQKVRRLAVAKYGYKPSLKSIVLATVQKIVLSVIPASLVFPLYTFVRGTKIKEKLENLNLRLAQN